MALPQQWTDILNGKNTNLRLGVVHDGNGRPMVTAMNSDGEAIGDMLPLDEVTGQGMPNPYGGASSASTISYDERTGQFGDAQDPAVTAYLAQHYPGMGLVHQNLGTDRFIDPSKVYDTPYGRVTSQDNVKAGESSMLEGMINPLTLFTLAMGIPTLPGGGSGLSSLADLVTGGNAAGGAGALGDAVTGIDSLAEANGLQVGNYTDLGGTLTAPTAGAATGALSNVPTTVEATGALADAAGGQTFPTLDGEGGMIPGNYTDLGGTLTPAATTGAGGALGDGTYPPLDGEGGMTPTTYGQAGGTMTPLEVSLRSMLGGLPAGLRSLLGGGTGAGGTGAIDWGKLLAGGAGVVGSMYATDKYNQLARDAMDMMGGDTLKAARKNALSRYETNAASPSAFLEDPWVKSALDQATKARTRALSKTTPVVGNPGAETDIQKTAISSLFGNLMLPYRQQLANEAGIASAPAQAAQLATSIGGKAIDSSMQGWNSAGYGMSGITGSGSSGGSGNSTNILDLINGFGNLAKTVGV